MEIRRKLRIQGEYAVAYTRIARRKRETMIGRCAERFWWNDEWWADRAWPLPDGERALFHGSLGNAHRIRAERPWTPGSFCATERFCCQVWYGAASRWLVHRSWVVCSAAHLVAAPGPLLDEIGAGDEVFVRPDSPLKPFSGRVVRREDLSLASLDFGFYYDDPSIPVVLTPVVEIGSEWRLVVVNRRPVAG